MPTVPTREGELVQSSPLPAPRINPGESSFGGDNAPVAEAGNRLLSGLNEIVQKEKKRADEIAFMDMDTQAAALSDRIETGVRGLQGRNAGNAPDYVKKEWDTGTADILKQANGRDQRDMLSRALQIRRQRLDHDVNVHMATEFKKYESDTTQARMEVAQNDAALHYGNAERVKSAFYEQAAAIDSFARSNGKDEAWSKAQKEKTFSATHRAIVSRMLTDGNVAAANQYIDDNKEQINGNDLGIIEKVKIETAQARADSQDKLERNVYIEAVNDRLTADQLDQMLESNQISIPFYEKALNRIKEVNDDPRIPLDQKSDRLVELTDAFIALGGKTNKAGTIIGGVPSEGGIFQDIPDRKALQEFRDRVAASSRYLTKEQEMNFYKYTERAYDSSLEAKKGLFRSFVQSLKLIPKITSESTSDAYSRAMSIFDPGVTLDQAQKTLDDARLESTVRTNPNRSRYKVGDVVTNPNGISGKVIGFDGRGNPLIETQ